MADLLYGCVGVDGRRKRKQREFRSIGFTIDGYTDEELRARYRFGKESIEYITDLLADNLRRKTNRNHPLSALQQVLIALRFYASGRLYLKPRREEWAKADFSAPFVFLFTWEYM